MLDDGTEKNERHGNVYMPNQRIMEDTDGKVDDRSPHNIKPIGGVMIANMNLDDQLIQAGGELTIMYKEQHFNVNDINCEIEEGYIIQGDGIERLLIEGLVRIAGRADYSEVEAEILKKAHKDSNAIQVGVDHYYGKSAAVLTPSKSYINNAEHDARFTLRITNRGPEAIVVKKPATLRFTVLGYEE